jgi:hypothetical protein
MVVFRVDPEAGLFRRRLGVVAGSVVCVLAWFGWTAHPGWQLARWITLPFVVLGIAVVARYFWNRPPPELVIDSTGVRLGEKVVSWEQVHHVELHTQASVHYGIHRIVYIRLGEGLDKADLSIFPPSVGATEKQIESALRRYAPPGLEFHRTEFAGGLAIPGKHGAAAACVI